MAEQGQFFNAGLTIKGARAQLQNLRENSADFAASDDEPDSVWKQDIVVLDSLDKLLNAFQAAGTTTMADALALTMGSIPPNAPLTSEELRAMDGEPLWFVSTNDGYGEWVIFQKLDVDEVWTFCAVGGTRRYDGDYGKDWLSYRRKPEPEADQSPRTRFSKIRACVTPESMAFMLNCNERLFCPKGYVNKQSDCKKPCGGCICDWLREEEPQ